MRSLKLFNSFRISVFAKYIIYIYKERDVFYFYNQARELNLPILILGTGSNVVFLDNYLGIVFVNRIRGIFVYEDSNYWYLHVGSGELWHDLVLFSVNNCIYGLENLALIPGTVGGAVFNNIGAYGVEFKEYCFYVDIINLKMGKKERFNSKDCFFDYRDSIFKHCLYNNFIITFVGIRLKKKWDPVICYLGLDFFDDNEVTSLKIFNVICNIRKKKFPNINYFGNAGSFFKNPVINNVDILKIILKYPNIPYYYFGVNRFKLFAGWLIDYCGLKGYVLGNVSVYCKQSLILINNNGQATGYDVVKLACFIRDKVFDEFYIFLEPEVSFIGRDGIKNWLLIF